MEDVVCCDANWNIDLDVDCPHCGYGFDVTDYITMGDLPPAGQSIKDCSVEVVCPECSRYFRIENISS